MNAGKLLILMYSYKQGNLETNHNEKICDFPSYF